MASSPPIAPTFEAAAAPKARSIVTTRRWVVLGLLCLAFIAAYFDRVNLSVVAASKSFTGEFGIGPKQIGWLGSAFFWAYAPMQFVAGWLVDRFGVKRSLAVGFVIWSVFAAFSGLAGTFGALFIFQMLMGMGESVVTPGGMRWIRFNYPEEKRGAAVGIYMAAAKVGPAVGLPLAGWLLFRFGWRAVFVITGLGCLVWLIPWLKFVRDDDRQIEAAQQRSSGGGSVPFAAVMKSPVIWGTFIGTWAYQYFVYFCMTWMPKYLADRRGLSLMKSGNYAGLTFLGMAVVAILAGMAADRLIAKGRDPVKVRKSFAIAGLLLASTELIGAFSTSLPVALTFAVVSLSGLGLMTANYWALTQTLIPGGSVGRIVGLQNFVANVPGIAAPILTGWLVQTTGKYEAPMVLISVFLVAAIAGYIFLVRREYAPKVVPHPVG
jgi:ACS family D-galactonate transporter-like MFS transporter